MQKSEFRSRTNAFENIWDQKAIAPSYVQYHSGQSRQSTTKDDDQICLTSMNKMRHINKNNTIRL